jgi:putative endonuclease
MLSKSVRILREAWTRFFPVRTLGARGEIAAAKFLRRLGYRIVHQNYSIGGGEFDIVAIDERTVVFVEVKTRSTDEFGSPAQSVDRNKQEQLSRLAHLYIRRYHLQEHHARFDVIAVVWPRNSRRPEIKHYRNAFPTTI